MFKGSRSKAIRNFTSAVVVAGGLAGCGELGSSTEKITPAPASKATVDSEVYRSYFNAKAAALTSQLAQRIIKLSGQFGDKSPEQEKVAVLIKTGQPSLVTGHDGTYTFVVDRFGDNLNDQATDTDTEPVAINIYVGDSTKYTGNPLSAVGIYKLLEDYPGSTQPEAFAWTAYGQTTTPDGTVQFFDTSSAPGTNDGESGSKLDVETLEAIGNFAMTILDAGGNNVQTGPHIGPKAGFTYILPPLSFSQGV